MIYGYMIDSTIEPFEKVDIDKLIESEILSFKNINSSMDILSENSIITEANIKSYISLFIVKVRELIRKLIIKFKEFFTKYSKKVLDNIITKKANEVSNFLDIMDDKGFIDGKEYKFILLVPKNEMNNLFSCIYDVDTNGIKIDDSEESLKKAENHYNESVKFLEITANLSEDLNKYFEQKTYISKSKEDILKIMAESTVNELDTEKCITVLKNQLKGLQSNLDYIENTINKNDNFYKEDGKPNKKISSYSHIYSLYINSINNILKALEKIYKIHLSVYIKNLDSIENTIKNNSESTNESFTKVYTKDGKRVRYTDDENILKDWYNLIVLGIKKLSFASIEENDNIARVSIKVKKDRFNNDIDKAFEFINKILTKSKEAVLKKYKNKAIENNQIDLSFRDKVTSDDDPEYFGFLYAIDAFVPYIDESIDIKSFKSIIDSLNLLKENGIDVKVDKEELKRRYQSLKEAITLEKSKAFNDQRS